MYSRKSRLSASKQARLIEHFVAGTTARAAARNWKKPPPWGERLKPTRATLVASERAKEGAEARERCPFSGCASVEAGST